MTEDQRKNMHIAQRYVELYHTTPERFVSECYQPDCTAIAMGVASFEGHKSFLEVEHAVLAGAPERRMRLVKMHPTDTSVVVEAVLEDPARGPDWNIPFCAVLEIREGKIQVDRTYADYNLWPGLSR